MITTLPAGWMLVPVDPTIDMLSAADNAGSIPSPRALRIYVAMLAAAPTPPACASCGGKGWIGGPSFYSPGEGGGPCPDCDTPPASAQDGPITITLDPDPRGVSVGVWQGSHCIYNGAHAVPVSAQDDAKDERQAFEAWAEDQGFVLDCDFFEVSGQYYDQDDTQLAYDIWRAARASVAAPAAGDVRDAERLDFLANHGAYVAWSKDRECCAVFLRDNEGNSGPMTKWGENWLTAREAIDAAIAAQQGKGGM